MSLITTIKPLAANHAEVQRALLSVQPSAELGVKLSPEKRFFGLFKRQPLIHLNGVHDLLSDDADWNAAFWSFRPEGAQELAKFLSNFSQTFTKTFIFASIWAGDDVGPDTKHLTITSAELAEAARTNQIGTKTFYEVVHP